MALGIAALAAMPAGQVDRATTHFLPAVAAVATVSMGWVVWRIDPAYTLSAAIFLTPFAGNWPQLGVPGPLSPDRLLLAGAIAAVLLRAPPVADRPRLQITGAHWVLALAAVYALASAFFAGTLFERDAFFKLVDAFGIMPFLCFSSPRWHSGRRASAMCCSSRSSCSAPTSASPCSSKRRSWTRSSFRSTSSTRTTGSTTLAAAGRSSTPWPTGSRSTCAPSRAPSPSPLGARAWLRALAMAVGLLCLVGSFLSLERSVWIGAVLGTGVAMLATRGLRRYLVPVAVASVASRSPCRWP